MRKQTKTKAVQPKQLLKSFPPFVEQSFQHPIQQLDKQFQNWSHKFKWQVEEKLYGLSATFYIKDGIFGVCTKNTELTINDNSIYWVMEKYNRIEEKLNEYFKQAVPGKLLGKNIAIQGEIIGNSINGNYYNQQDHRFYVFDIYDIDSKQYWLPSQRNVFCKKYDFYQVPILEINRDLKTLSTDEIVKLADGESVISDTLGRSPIREGLIFKSMVGYESFKVTSEKFLASKDKNLRTAN